MPQIVHEYNEKGQHRIVKISDDSTNEASPWADIHSLATLGKMLAHGGSVDQELPLGIFTVRDIPHQVLS